MQKEMKNLLTYLLDLIYLLKKVKRFKQVLLWLKFQNHQQRVVILLAVLPRVTELFEARSPQESCIVSEIEGKVKFGASKKGSSEIIIESLING
jgi:hypothetical protein